MSASAYGRDDQLRAGDRYAMVIYVARVSHEVDYDRSCKPLSASFPPTFVLLLVVTVKCITFELLPPFVFVSQITNTEYFAPLLTVNQHASHTVLEEIPSVNTFASLSNWLVRPVPTVTAAVRRFRERYFEDNYVIGEQTFKHSVLIKKSISACLKIEVVAKPNILRIALRPTLHAEVAIFHMRVVGGLSRRHHLPLRAMLVLSGSIWPEIMAG